jgi:C4-dicarboxylate transporter, DctM subunit
MILYAVAAEVSLGKLFLAGIGPGLLLITLFAIYSVWRYRQEHRTASAEAERTGIRSAILVKESYTRAEKIRLITKVMPFVILLTGVMIALYGGYATPSETAGLGAILSLLIIAIMYRVYTWSRVYPILAVTLQESTMLMFIIGMSLLYSYVMSYLHISQSAAAWIIGMQLSKWVLLATILVFVVVLGFFLPPVSIILMTAPIVLPPLKAAGFDLIWFGIVMTIVMETGLIHPPVGLNIFVIKNIAPDIPLSDIIWGVMPFVGIMIATVILLCFMPGIAMWLPAILSS